MDLRETLLGLLNQKPASGYDLKRVIAESDLFYWSGNNNQIYKVLLELQQEGLVTFEVQTQASLPTKKVYTLTDQGRRVLREGLLRPPEVPEIHKNFLIQLACAQALTDKELLTLFERYTVEVQAGLDLARGLADRALKRLDNSRQTWLDLMTRENIVQTWQAELDWARRTREELQEKTNKDKTKRN